MTTCHGCGGLVGRDCFNPQECEEIARDKAMRYDEQSSKQCPNCGRTGFGCGCSFVTEPTREQQFTAAATELAKGMLETHFNDWEKGEPRCICKLCTLARRYLELAGEPK